jgi:hypothetical protein
MRTRFGIIVAISLTLAACGDAAPPPQAAQDLLIMRTSRGLTVAAAGDTTATYQEADAVPSGDWSTAVSAWVVKNSTTLTAVNPTSGASLWERQLDRQLQVKVVSYTGDLVALGPVHERYHDQGRKVTHLKVISGGGAAADRDFSVDGNYEPEAFSTDGTDLFLIQYLPAMHPVAYRVRKLDLSTGKVAGVYTIDKDLQESMKGTARVQTMAPDGSRLYTLYSLRTGGKKQTFVHVLNLDEKWAHCIDLPDGFAQAAEMATALTVSPDGTRLFVANSRTENVAVVDTAHLKVLKTNEGVDFSSGSGLRALRGTHATGGADEVFVSGGHSVSAIDPGDLTQQDSWSVEQPVTGLQVSSDGEKLYIGQEQEVVVIDLQSGEEVDVVDPPGIGKIGVLGPSTESVELFGDFVCAC